MELWSFQDALTYMLSFKFPTFKALLIVRVPEKISYKSVKSQKIHKSPG